MTLTLTLTLMLTLTLTLVVTLTLTLTIGLATGLGLGLQTELEKKQNLELAVEKARVAALEGRAKYRKDRIAEMQLLIQLKQDMGMDPKEDQMQLITLLKQQDPVLATAFTTNTSEHLLSLIHI
eukprot:TRINITY_DN14273_c0_g1_i1.p2 TRINITY_DN14273_c0_g1~~TRINITY_DN14273_c0_g1_i1.p2  ORF type:complete len:124 (-),score=24.84 TRINITY_DN14273_c0_g1_i1:169-540(-)